MKVVISPTYRYFLGSKDICVFWAYLQFWQTTEYLNVSSISITAGIYLPPNISTIGPPQIVCDLG